MNPPETIAHYRIGIKLGEGGMGAVYQATDTKLGREVAIKLLPEAFAADAGRMARFTREAQVLASLNHPNIAAIYGAEDRALVMEIVPGPTLAGRIAKGPIQLEKALRIAAQIAEALEYAHDRGIVHRDLKPSNIKVTSEGRVKVLDFGLAKAISIAPLPADPKSSPTLTMGATMAGVILGTAAYMSPEQARGHEVDARADIWAFGVVLYEMLTGRELFAGPTVSDTLASVLKTDPDMSTVPARVRPLLERCLRKDARARWRNIGDVRLEIDGILADPNAAPGESRTTPPESLLKGAIQLLAVALLAAAIGGLLAWRWKPSPTLAITRFPIAFGEGQRFSNVGRPMIAISPDGSRIAYVANNQLYLRSMDDVAARPITGTGDPAGVSTPVFSPDGQSLVFWSAADSTLKKIAVGGGVPVTICEAPNPWGMTWSGDEIVYGAGGNGILRVSPSGGKPQVLVPVNKGEIAAHPQLLPGGSAVLFTLASDEAGFAWDKVRIVVQTLPTGPRKTLVEGASAGRYIPTGYIVFAVSGVLFAVPFDTRRLEVTGERVPIVEGVQRSIIGVAQFNFSGNGTLVYIPGSAGASSGSLALALVDRRGAMDRLNLPPARYYSPRVSRDGKSLAYGIIDGNRADIWIYSLAGNSAPRRLTFQGANRYPTWSPDGEWIAFQSDREGDLGIFRQRADGSGTAERLTRPEKGTSHIPNSWSPNGQYLSLTAEQGNSASVWTYSLRDQNVAIFAEDTSARLSDSVFSPDGRWLAYQSIETREFRVFVQPFPANGTKYQIPGKAVYPVWSSDGKHLFFAPGPGEFAAVSVSGAKGLSFSAPVSEPWGQLAVSSITGARNYDILPDGRLIGMTHSQTVSGSATPEIMVALNWFEDLKRRAPVR